VGGFVLLKDALKRFIRFQRPCPVCGRLSTRIAQTSPGTARERWPTHPAAGALTNPRRCRIQISAP